jgi:TRIAD3 protein (E3 ubiquitin-protein ligase RNF216)
LAKDIDQIFNENDKALFPTYLKLVKREVDGALRPKTRPQQRRPEYEGDGLDVMIRTSPNGLHVEALRELKVARQAGATRRIELVKEKEEKQGEEDNLLRAMAEGTMDDCGTCYSEIPLNRMVHCNGDTLHWFCRDCARKNAESQIGHVYWGLLQRSEGDIS